MKEDNLKAIPKTKIEQVKLQGEYPEQWLRGEGCRSRIQRTVQ